MQCTRIYQMSLFSVSIKLSLAALSLVGGFEALEGLQFWLVQIPNIWISFNHNMRYLGCCSNQCCAKTFNDSSAGHRSWTSFAKLCNPAFLQSIQWVWHLAEPQQVPRDAQSLGWHKFCSILHE